MYSTSDELPHKNLCNGNQIALLHNGEEAFPAMLREIDAARKSIALATYHFTNDDVGNLFAEALGKAVKRGVQVRVLIDGYGALAAGPSIVRRLRRSGIDVMTFSSPFSLKNLKRLNYRNHRKILVVDRHVGFTGGINIFDAALSCGNHQRPMRDMHFRISGPLVGHLMLLFAKDWRETTGEILEGEGWTHPPNYTGSVKARIIGSDPHVNFPHIRSSLVAMLSLAQESIQIVTPYFMPTSIVMDALLLAAKRGVSVIIIVPESNRPIIKLAMFHFLSRSVTGGCRVYLSEAPYDHSKLLAIDGKFCLAGSSNWDARSLCWNYECDLIFYDSIIAKEIGGAISQRRLRSRELGIHEIESWSSSLRLAIDLSQLVSPLL